MSANIVYLSKPGMKPSSLHPAPYAQLDYQHLLAKAVLGMKAMYDLGGYMTAIGIGPHGRAAAMMRRSRGEEMPGAKDNTMQNLSYGASGKKGYTPGEAPIKPTMGQTTGTKALPNSGSELSVDKLSSQRPFPVASDKSAGLELLVDKMGSQRTFPAPGEKSSYFYSDALNNVYEMSLSSKKAIKTYFELVAEHLKGLIGIYGKKDEAYGVSAAKQEEVPNGVISLDKYRRKKQAKGTSSGPIIMQEAA